MLSFCFFLVAFYRRKKRTSRGYFLVLFLGEQMAVSNRLPLDASLVLGEFRVAHDHVIVPVTARKKSTRSQPVHTDQCEDRETNHRLGERIVGPRILTS